MTTLHTYAPANQRDAFTLASTSTTMNQHADVYVHVHVPRAASDSQLLSFNPSESWSVMQRSSSTSSHLSSSAPAYKRAGSLHLLHNHPSSSLPSSPRRSHIHIHPANDRPTASTLSAPNSPSASSTATSTSSNGSLNELASNPSTPASSVGYEPSEVELESKTPKPSYAETSSKQTSEPSSPSSRIPTSEVNGSLLDSTVTGALDCATSPTFGAKSTASSSPLAALQDTQAEVHPIVRAVQAGQISLDALLAFPVNWNNLAHAFVSPLPVSSAIQASPRGAMSSSASSTTTSPSSVPRPAAQPISRPIKASARAARWTSMLGEERNAARLSSIPEVDLSSSPSPCTSTISLAAEKERPMRRRRVASSSASDSLALPPAFDAWSSTVLASPRTTTPPLMSCSSLSSGSSISSACSASSGDSMNSYSSPSEVREPRLAPIDLPPLEDFGWYTGCVSQIPPTFAIPRTPLEMEQVRVWEKSSSSNNNNNNNDDNAMGLSGLNMDNEHLREGLNATLAQWPFSAPPCSEHGLGLATGLTRGQSGGLGLSLVA